MEQETNRDQHLIDELYKMQTELSECNYERKALRNALKTPYLELADESVRLKNRIAELEVLLIASIKILLRTIEKLEGKISETNKLMDLACTNLEDGFPDKALKIIYQIRKNG